MRIPKLTQVELEEVDLLFLLPSFQAVIVFMYIMHSWYLYLNILKENFIIYVPNRIKLKKVFEETSK